MAILLSMRKHLNFGILACVRAFTRIKMPTNPCPGCRCSSTLAGANCSPEPAKTGAAEFSVNYVDILKAKGGHKDVKYTRLDELSSLLKTTESGLRKADGSLAQFLHVPPEVLTRLTSIAFTEIMHFLRTEHLSQLRRVFDDPESSDNDRFVSMQLLKNACISAGKVLPGCQDTGTAIVLGKRGNLVFSEGDATAIAKGVYDSYLKRNFR